MRGVGQTRKGLWRERGYSIAMLARDLGDILDAAGVDRVHYCGEAFWAPMGMQFAADFPDRVRTASFLSGPVYLHQKVQSIFAVGETSWSEAIRKLGVRAWAEATNTVPRFPPWMAPGFLEWYTSELAKDDRETLATFSEFCAVYDQREHLPRITVPEIGRAPV